MKMEDQAAHTNFLERDPTKFCKFHMSLLPKSDMIENNVCETFNGYIAKVRGRPIIDMLKDIRESLMERMHQKLNEMSKVTDTFCPRIISKLEEMKYNLL